MKMAKNDLNGPENPDPDKPLRKARYHHGNLRADLIEATRQLVEEKGPDGFSVSDACRLAGVSTAAPYKHFKDKTDMLVAVSLEGMKRLADNMLTSIANIPKGTPERITAIGKQYVLFAQTEPGVFRLKFGGFTDRLDDERLELAGEQTFQIVLTEVAACLNQTEITQDVSHKSFALWSFVHGLSFILHNDKMADMAGILDLDTFLSDMSYRVLRTNVS